MRTPSSKECQRRVMFSPFTKKSWPQWTLLLSTLYKLDPINAFTHSSAKSLLHGYQNIPSTLPSTTRLQMTEKNKSIFKTPLARRAFLASSVLALGQLYYAQAYAPSDFKRIPTQFIAALGDPNSKSGTNARDWGLWTVDPGPRGVFLDKYQSQLVNRGGVAPAGWKFDEQDWWLEEHGLIMEAPTFSVPPGRYLVTGGRRVTTTLTIDPPDEKTGEQKWKLDEGKLFDVTHLPCRSARYHPKSDGEEGSPATANQKDFPVSPGAEMPSVPGCEKQDYAVIFLIGKAVESVA